MANFDDSGRASENELERHPRPRNSNGECNAAGYVRSMVGHIVAIGGVSPDVDDSALDRFVFDLAGVANPRVCFLPTASGDAVGYIDMFYGLFPRSVCEPTHLTLFSPPLSPPAELLAEQDVIYVGGGSTPNLLAIWRLHGIDELLRAAWQRGAVLCGASAGSMCWFESGLTDAHGQ